MVYIGQMTLQDEDAYSGIRLNEVLVLNAFLPALSQGRLRSRIRYANSSEGTVYMFDRTFVLELSSV